MVTSLLGADSLQERSHLVAVTVMNFDAMMENAEKLLSEKKMLEVHVYTTGTCRLSHHTAYLLLHAKRRTAHPF